MVRGIRFEDAIKTVVGLAILGAAMVSFGPGILDRYGITLNFTSPPNSNPTLEHEIALKVEADHPKLDVLNIRTLEDRIVMTVLDIAGGGWSDEDIEQLTEVTFYLVELAMDGELSIVTQIFDQSEAITVETDTVNVYFHKETLACGWHVLKQYDGTNATSLIRSCLVHPGTWLEIEPEDILWIGRGE